MNSSKISKKIILSIIFYLFINSALAISCEDIIIKKYVSNITYSPAKTLCGVDLNLLLIKLKKTSNNNETSLGGISLDVKNSNDVSVTRYALKSMNSSSNKIMTACLNKNYIENSSLIFSITREKSEHSTNHRSLTLKSTHTTCKLKSLVSNT
ncbi:hypothetical protein ACM9HF_02350 [Colwellia sp. RE-S-Sl-9]